jgi:hypothetical protein
VEREADAMEYFILGRDECDAAAIRLPGLAKLIKDNGLPSGKWDEADDLPVQLYIETRCDGEYGDFVAGPVPIVSERLKQLYQKFDSQIFFKPLVLADVTRMRQELYWLMNPPDCDCIAAESEFNKDGTVKRLVIDQAKTEGKWIFKAAGILERLIVVNLGVAECMLRRDFYGVKLQRIATLLRDEAEPE